VAEDRNHWRALVNTVINIPIPYNFGNSSVSEQFADSEAGLNSI
jgi:hypothetical protein